MISMITDIMLLGAFLAVGFTTLYLVEQLALKVIRKTMCTEDSEPPMHREPTDEQDDHQEV